MCRPIIYRFPDYTYINARHIAFTELQSLWHNTIRTHHSPLLIMSKNFIKSDVFPTLCSRYSPFNVLKAVVYDELFSLAGHIILFQQNGFLLLGLIRKQD